MTWTINGGYRNMTMTTGINTCYISEEKTA